MNNQLTSEFNQPAYLNNQLPPEYNQQTGPNVLRPESNQQSSVAVPSDSPPEVTRGLLASSFLDPD